MTTGDRVTVKRPNGSTVEVTVDQENYLGYVGTTDDGEIVVAYADNIEAPSTDVATGERIAYDRSRADACERGTPGCSIHHTSNTSCQTW